MNGFIHLFFQNNARFSERRVYHTYFFTFRGHTGDILFCGNWTFRHNAQPPWYQEHIQIHSGVLCSWVHEYWNRSLAVIDDVVQEHEDTGALKNQTKKNFNGTSCQKGCRSLAYSVKLCHFENERWIMRNGQTQLLLKNILLFISTFFY